MNGPPVYCIATMDTKGAELKFVTDLLRKSGVNALMVDAGIQTAPQVDPDVTRGQLTAVASGILNKVIVPPWQLRDRGEAVASMSEILTAFLVHESGQTAVGGVLGLGGSGGTALITAAMRALPIGIPKVMVSTVAAGNVGPYVDCSDIIMVPSIVDIAGLNTVSKTVLANAACALAGMVHGQAAEHESATPSHATEQSPLATVAMTMFGVTTPCVMAIREQLERDQFECFVFHATGIGGRTMEKLVDSGLVQGVLDITTTEVADQVVGGVFPAGERRFEAIIRSGVPYVLSVGALDMVNFRGIESVPEQFRPRKLHVHNEQITLMRTTPEENRQFAAFMAHRLNAGTGPWTLLIPENGVSALDAPGQPFHDPEADQLLFSELEQLLKTNQNRRILRLPLHINDPEFASACIREFRSLWNDGRN